LEEANENIAAISNLCLVKELYCDSTKNFVLSDENLTTHYSFEFATDLLEERNTQNEEVEDEEEGEEAAGGQDTSTKIHTHEQALHCISEVMRFAINSISSSLLELLYTVKDCKQRIHCQLSNTSY
jgi:hypothetical protein